MTYSGAKYLLALATGAFLAMSGAHAANPALQRGIEAVIAEEGLTGIAWSLIGKDGEVSLGTAGQSDNSSGTDFTIQTRFHVGSLTKSVLATGVLRLVTEGLVELDTPASLHLPGVAFSNPWSDTDEITIRHLLDHTSGLNDAYMWQIFSERAEPDTPLVEAFPDPNVQLRVRSRPGSRFSYSNIGYTLLGMIIESVADDRYERYLNQSVLFPLNMRESTFSFTTQESASADHRLAWGHLDDGTKHAAIPVFLRPAAQFTTTAGDLATFAKFLLGDGTVDGQVFVDKPLMSARGHPFGTEARDAGLLAGYALGLGRRDRHGVVGFCHSGNIVGFLAMLCIFPDEQKAFAYSVNTDSETADYGRIDAQLINELGIAGAEAPLTDTPSRDATDWIGRYVLSPNRFQSFEYLDRVFGNIRISANEGSFVLTPLQGDPRELRPLGGFLFSAEDRTTASHVFLRGVDGEYLISDGFQTFQKVSLTYLVVHWVSIVLGILGITWLFVAGLFSILRSGTEFMRRPETPAFIAVALLFVPVPFFLAQSFTTLGDLTIASGLLAVVSVLLPLGMFLTVLRAKKPTWPPRLELCNTLAAVCVLQWCVALALGDLLPLRLWA